MPQFPNCTTYTALNTSTVNPASHQYDPIGRPVKSTIAMGANFSNGLLSGTPAQLTESGSSIGPLQTAYNDGNEPWAIVVTDESGSVSGLVRKFFLDGFGRTNKIVDGFNGSNYATNTL